MTRPLRASRRTYNRLNSNSDSSSALTQEHDLNQNEHLNSNDVDDEKEHIEISILDSAHAKFSVPASPDWSVLHFKKVGATVHKVPPRAQRLIHMGKLLKDDQTLRFYGIDKPGTIVHLFPKPNVVVLADTDSNTTDTNASNVDVHVDSHTASNNATPTPNTGAHVPQIVLDAQEAERRSQILILSSNEIFEAQHKVRLLSFLLLIICAMELLTLFTVLIGVPTDQPNPDGTQHDDFFSPTDPADQSDPTQLRTWQNTDYADLAVSAFGFYVATLGIKASTENTARLAKQYFYCLLLAGISWNAYYYMLSLKAQEARQQAHDNKDTDTDDQDYNDDAAPAPAPDNPNSANPNVYTQALLGILIPMCVWITCFLRAWQFHQLILEAELEAEQRAIANDEEMNRNMDTETALDMDMNVDEHEHEHEEQTRGSQNRDTQSLNTSIRRGDHSPVPYGTVDQDLVLQVDHGTIT